MFVFDFESKSTGKRVEKTLITESRGGGGESHSDTAMIIF